MQVPIVFQLNGTLSYVRYLPGQYQWPSAARLTAALVVCPFPLANTLTLQLEVGGVLTGDVIELPLVSAMPQSYPLAVPVPANSAVRWRASVAGNVLGAPMQVQVTVVWEPVAGVAPVDLSLQWVNGPERLRLFNYDPANQSFTDVSNGLSVGRAFVDPSNGISFFLQGVEQLRVRNGVVQSPNFGVGVPFTGMPRLEFTRNGLAMGVLSGDGFFVPELIELSGFPASGSNGFDFYTNATLTATLGNGALWLAAGWEGPLT